jgi:hypothetical protein
MDLLRWMLHRDITVEELDSCTKEPLNIVSFAVHLLDIDSSKKQPVSLGRAVVREFFLKSLSASGMDRRELAGLSNDELDRLWNKLPGPKMFTPFPTPYEVVPCYRWILVGIAHYGATRFVARQAGLQALDCDAQVVHEFEGIDQRKALRFIGLADEVLRPFISRFGWDEETTVLVLGLSREQITEFKEYVKLEAS